MTRNIRHDLLDSIKSNLNLAKELSWIKERDSNYLGELSFDIIFNYDDFERTLDKTLMLYCDNYFDKREEYEELVKKIKQIKESNK